MLTDSERFVFETRRHHAFASTGNAYDASQCDEAIKTGDQGCVVVTFRYRRKGVCGVEVENRVEKCDGD